MGVGAHMHDQRSCCVLCIVKRKIWDSSYPAYVVAIGGAGTTGALIGGVVIGGAGTGGADTGGVDTGGADIVGAATSELLICVTLGSKFLPPLHELRPRQQSSQDVENYQDMLCDLFNCLPASQLTVLLLFLMFVSGVAYSYSITRTHIQLHDKFATFLKICVSLQDLCQQSRATPTLTNSNNNNNL
uniref:Uncharacterized protein n=1 Tax=Glossina pallidipes TaxID=7398 RepID=A0A1B0ACF5_GLOPL